MPSFIVRPRVHSLGALALALLSLMAAQANANQRTVYKGTLQGAGEVVLELDDAAGAGGVVSGRYFYPKSGVDIPLRGTGDVLYEPKPHPAQPPVDLRQIGKLPVEGLRVLIDKHDLKILQ